MIGASRIIIGKNPTAPPPPQDLDAFISPSFLSTVTPNGAYTSPRLKINASGGTEPYTYEWSADADIVLSGTTSNTITFSCYGYRREITGFVYCKVTDAAMDEKEASIPITVTLGIPL